MRRVSGESTGSSRWRLAVPVAVALVFLAAGVAFGGYFASQAIDGTSVAQESEEPTAVSSPSPTPAPEPTVPPSVTQPPRGALGCVDCAVKGRDQLEVIAEDIQLGLDGKYYIPDRGDGCAYREGGRVVIRGVEMVSLWAPGCEQGWTYEPATGRVHALIS